MDNTLIVKEMVDYLDHLRKWDLYVIITFRQSTGHALALRKFKRFFKYLNTAEQEYYTKFISAYVFFDYCDSSKQDVHIHALIEGINPSMAELLKERCIDYFGFAKIKPYDPTRDVKYYLSQKIVLPNLADHDLYKINSRLRSR